MGAACEHPAEATSLPSKPQARVVLTACLGGFFHSVITHIWASSAAELGVASAGGGYGQVKTCWFKKYIGIYVLRTA